MHGPVGNRFLLVWEPWASSRSNRFSEYLFENFFYIFIGGKNKVGGAKSVFFRRFHHKLFACLGLSSSFAVEELGTDGMICHPWKMVPCNPGQAPAISGGRKRAGTVKFIHLHTAGGCCCRKQPRIAGFDLAIHQHNPVPVRWAAFAASSKSQACCSSCRRRWPGSWFFTVKLTMTILTWGWADRYR